MRQLERQRAALSGLRVLDLTGNGLQYCGKLFAQLGADVILVEPRYGSRSRREGPFLDDKPHPERSLTFAYFNQGKRGIVLDLDTPDGQRIFRELAQTADLLIEAESVGAMTRRGLDAPSLSAHTRRLVVCSITAFGQSGPYSRHHAEDLTLLAMGGLLYLAGDADAAPMAAHGGQALLAGAQFAAVASMAALLQAESCGMGQLLDVSIQEAVSMALENAVQFYDLERTIRTRKGSEQRQAGSGLFACKDGMVYLMAGGLASSRFWHATAEWMIEGGAPGAESLLGNEWAEQSYLESDEGKRRFAGVFGPFAADRTKAELYEQGQARRIPICPLNTTADLVESRQLRHRNHFQTTLHQFSGRSFEVPGAPYHLSATPWGLGSPAPTLGQHTCEIMSSLGHDRSTQAAWVLAGVTA